SSPSSPASTTPTPSPTTPQASTSQKATANGSTAQPSSPTGTGAATSTSSATRSSQKPRKSSPRLWKSLHGQGRSTDQVSSRFDCFSWKHHDGAVTAPLDLDYHVSMAPNRVETAAEALEPVRGSEQLV